MTEPDKSTAQGRWDKNINNIMTQKTKINSARVKTVDDAKKPKPMETKKNFGSKKGSRLSSPITKKSINNS